ncbi:hypothetical protein [Opitutus sp. ER46]|uniref:hypothetical protein n=1 Tax=Opitutus sp. ER46 TaxID=2161864 RepID=UPI000D317EA2|nr:hypothetical protein [Opitutus sp. ER46]PTX96616.1 hypothetical protein DB354_08135 [Opitutus sp. ER46]
MSEFPAIASLPLAAADIGALMPLIVVVFFIISIVRAIRQAQRARQEHEARRDESEADRRAQEIRERLRRLSAERRGETAPPPLVREGPPVVASAPAAAPAAPQPRVPPLDPFGGGALGKRIGRVLTELERTLNERGEEPQPAPVIPEWRRLELERERLEAERAAAERRLAAAREQTGGEGPSGPVVRHEDRFVIQAKREAEGRRAARGRLLEDLASPDALRRAIVLREVLGPPVSLRR